MKKINLKHSIWDLLVSIIGIIIALIGIIVLIDDREFGLYLILYLLLFILFFIGLVVSIKHIQWTIIDNNKIIVKNIFGTINKIELSLVKKTFISNLIIFSMRSMNIRKDYIAISENKSLKQSVIVDAYNRKGTKYIVIPYDKNIENFIKEQYKLVTGNDLIIKSKK